MSIIIRLRFLGKGKLKVNTLGQCCWYSKSLIEQQLLIWKEKTYPGVPWNNFPPFPSYFRREKYQKPHLTWFIKIISEKCVRDFPKLSCITQRNETKLVIQLREYVASYIKPYYLWGKDIFLWIFLFFVCIVISVFVGEFGNLISSWTCPSDL